MFDQIVSITGMNLRNIPSRWSTSLVVVVGIGGVVAVLVAMLAMATGLERVFSKATSPDRAIAVRTGSDSEMSSNLSMDTARIIATLDGVAFATPELYVVADVPKKNTGTPANMVVRGVEPGSFDIRPEFEIAYGRMFESGRNEVIVGIKALAEFAGLDIGSRLSVRDTSWEVVGIFETDGSVDESEVWADMTVVQAAFRRGQSITAVRVLLDSINSYSSVQQLIEDDPRLPVNLTSEEAWYASQAESSTQVIRIFGIVVAVIMSIGAIFAALNTMYSAVASRTFEIATLRAVGFRGGPILVSVLSESMVLAILGGLAGAALAFFAFNGFTVSTLGQQSFSMVAFEFMVTPALVLQSLVLSVVLGFIGGIFPAFRAVFLPVTTALRGE